MLRKAENIENGAIKINDVTIHGKPGHRTSISVWALNSILAVVCLASDVTEL